MATTLQAVETLIDEIGLKYKTEDGDRPHIVTGFETKNYRDVDGDSRLLLVIQLEENGEYIKILAPNCYCYKDGPHKKALFEACLAISWKTKLIQFEYDLSDGEVRCIIEWPLEDATLTKRQLERCVSGIVQMIDEYHEVINTAMETGKVVFPDEGEEVNELRRHLQQLLEKLENLGEGAEARADLDLEE